YRGDGRSQLPVAFDQARAWPAEEGLADRMDAVVYHRWHFAPTLAATHLVGAIVRHLHPAPAHHHDVGPLRRRVRQLQRHAPGIHVAPGIAAARALDEVVDPGAPRRGDHWLGPPLH